ncbi:restriction endonuclease subunit S [Marinobacterium arenosum]|uniref:restriction endonuclease subunit S n=1 Tax=Marinobacterium arenosum TaxID=2862496 RepID=UPI001C94A722|nr:restriction endonuclease subunit S [Marinobacterium arenosum]MBY4678891.1 restriction endonuclease subunit S [Marinobacterium arenosum]
MGKYQAYRDYKDSEIDWLGLIPANWKVMRLKRLFVIKKRIAGTLGFEVLSITQRGIKVKDIETGDGQLSMDYSKYQKVEVGDFAMNHMDLLTGFVDISKYTGVTSPDYRVFSLKSENLFYKKYYLYLLQMGYKQKLFFHLGQGSAHLGRWRLPTEEFNEIEYPVPPKEEQSTVAAFLDHETTKIDTLIEKQQQLIKLLKEKRQAVISQAVTKGLNPDAPMKDSGVEWLGDVPEHWKVGYIKQFAKIESGHTPDKKKEEYWVDCDIPWVSLNDSKSLKIVNYIEDTKYKVNKLGIQNSSARLLPDSAVVFTRDASIGLAAITKKPMAVSQHIIAWLCHENLLIPEFLLLVFYAMTDEFERYTFGATIKTIGMDDVKSLRAALPPISEQEELVTTVFNKMDSMDKAIAKAESFVALLQERRTALISAAVTGKIDVRNWLPPVTKAEADSVSGQPQQLELPVSGSEVAV